MVSQHSAMAGVNLQVRFDKRYVMTCQLTVVLLRLLTEVTLSINDVTLTHTDVTVPPPLVNRYVSLEQRQL